jgi:DNA-binding NtrC family response regulator
VKYGLPPLPVDLRELIAEVEDLYVAAALSSGGNRTKAAKLLGLGRTTLVEKLRRQAMGGRRNGSYRSRT